MNNADVAPIPFWQSFLIFGVPGTLIFFGVHYLVPVLTQAGVPLIFAWSASVLLPIIGNAVVIIAIYLKQEKPDWATFVRRFRLQKLERKYWVLIPVIFILIAPGSIPRSLLRTFNFEIWKLKCLGACPEDLYFWRSMNRLPGRFQN